MIVELEGPVNIESHGKFFIEGIWRCDPGSGEGKFYWEGLSPREGSIVSANDSIFCEGNFRTHSASGETRSFHETVLLQFSSSGISDGILNVNGIGENDLGHFQISGSIVPIFGKYHFNGKKFYRIFETLSTPSSLPDCSSPLLDFSDEESFFSEGDEIRTTTTRRTFREILDDSNVRCGEKRSISCLFPSSNTNNNNNNNNSSNSSSSSWKSEEKEIFDDVDVDNNCNYTTEGDSSNNIPLGGGAGSFFQGFCPIEIARRNAQRWRSLENTKKMALCRSKSGSAQVRSQLPKPFLTGIETSNVTSCAVKTVKWEIRWMKKNRKIGAEAVLTIVKIDGYFSNDMNPLGLVCAANANRVFEVVCPLTDEQMESSTSSTTTTATAAASTTTSAIMPLSLSRSVSVETACSSCSGENKNPCGITEWAKVVKFEHVLPNLEKGDYLAVVWVRPQISTCSMICETLSIRECSIAEKQIFFIPSRPYTPDKLCTILSRNESNKNSYGFLKWIYYTKKGLTGFKIFVDILSPDGSEWTCWEKGTRVIYPSKLLGTQRKGSQRAVIACLPENSTIRFRVRSFNDGGDSDGEAISCKQTVTQTDATFCTICHDTFPWERFLLEESRTEIPLHELEAEPENDPDCMSGPDLCCHLFHAGCLNHWAAKKPTCPNCNAQFMNIVMHKTENSCIYVPINAPDLFSSRRQDTRPLLRRQAGGTLVIN